MHGGYSESDKFKILNVTLVNYITMST
ncbi:protein of unknown function [Magnetospirillum sp. XM-1]|nr:protein of unknown function [Magnetospirillum sp. XM-1]